MHKRLDQKQVRELFSHWFGINAMNNEDRGKECKL